MITKLTHPTLIVICGWPASGKTTLAEKLRETLTDPESKKIHLADIDQIRRTCLGMPYPHPNESDALMTKDKLEMGGAYVMLQHTIRWHLAKHRSLIATATFSSRIGQEALLRSYEEHFENCMGKNEIPMALRVVKCVPTSDTQKQVEDLFAKRAFGSEAYVGGVNSPERYFEVKERYHPILLPHRTIRTWPTNDIENEWTEALEYIFS